MKEILIFQYLYQTNFTLNFYGEIKGEETSKEVKAVLAGSPGGLIAEQVEKFNVSLNWSKFSRIGSLGSSELIDRTGTVLDCKTGADSGVATLANILYVGGSQ